MHKEEVMRLGLLIRDTEYRDALIEMMSEFDKDLFIEIAGESGASSDSVILTDVRPEEIGSDVLSRLRDRTVFITCVKSQSIPSQDILSETTKIHRVFKYSRISSIMAELSLVYCRWTGDAGNSMLTKSIAVCAASDAYCSSRCMTLARQIIYRRGGSVLVLPLGFINDYGMDGSDDCSSFARLMYMIDADRDFPPEAFTASDSYGISYLTLPAGANPIAYLDDANLNMLIRTLSVKFDTVIYDIGTGYRMENVRIMRSADHTIYFGTDHRKVDVGEMLGDDHRSAFREFKVTGETDELLRIDDYVRELFSSAEKGSNIKSRNGN